MRDLAAYQDKGTVWALAEQLQRLVTRPWTIMEVCGGQTHAILRYGIDQLLPSGVTLLHGPGCPVCVTPTAIIEQAQRLALLPGVALCTFGDMLRVPGREEDLAAIKARGGDVRLVQSPLGALELAQRHRDLAVVLLAIGFETTAPAYALALRQAAALGLTNFFLLPALARVVPAMELICADRDSPVDAFLAAGHVAAVTGTAELKVLAARWQRPVVVTGFEPVDLMVGLEACLRHLEAKEAVVVNAYPRVVGDLGNALAQEAVASVFVAQDMEWRGLGLIPQGGLGLRPAFGAFDASRRFPLAPLGEPNPTACQAGLVLRGRLKPSSCPAFGRSCTPASPLGAPMVSGEGACAAYFGRFGAALPPSAAAVPLEVTP